MNYYEKLNKMIEESDLTLKEIAEKCKLHGISINPSYISKLRTEKQPPASDEVNIAIARACGFEEQIEDFLFEAYLEKSPKYIKGLLLDIVNMLLQSAKTSLKALLPPNQFPLAEIQLNQMTKYQILRHTLDSTLALNSNNVIPAKTIQMPDDSMEPLIPEKSVLYLEEVDTIQDGDIIVAIINDSYIVRKHIIIENKSVLISLKQGISPLMTDSQELTIIGKTTKIMMTLN